MCQVPFWGGNSAYSTRILCRFYHECSFHGRHLHRDETEDIDPATGRFHLLAPCHRTWSKYHLRGTRFSDVCFATALFSPLKGPFYYALLLLHGYRQLWQV